MRAPDGVDAVVVGAGPNGLVAAVTLAAAGRTVLLVEAADRVGGALRSRELTLPGYRHDIGATVLPLALASAAFRQVRPQDDGVEWAHPPIPAAHPVEGCDAALVYRDAGRTARELGRDARAWHFLVGATAAAGPPLVDTLLSPLGVPKAPISALRYGLSGVLPATWVGRGALRTSRGRAVFAGMAAHSVLSLSRPVTSGYGTLLAALAHGVGWPVVRGGSQNLADALAARLERLGGEIRTGMRVTTLDELPPSPIVVLDLTPRQVLAVAGHRLPDPYRRRLERFRYGPGVFKLDWALDGPVPWQDARVVGAGTVHVGNTFEEVAAGERDVARGRHPERPFVLCVQPTVADPSRAPSGRHTLWAYCHVPNGSDLDQTAAIEAQIERFAPGFRERILARHSMATKALEAFDANLVGGDIGGGAADLRQFAARPVLSLEPWATPVPGLFIGSASTPPGGGVHGMGGWQAARVALRRSTGRRSVF